jgi:long-chain acyl-CoA synthetase
MPTLVFVSGKLQQDSIDARKVFVPGKFFDSAINASQQAQPLEQTQADDLACILYTSGTTAKPKGVMLSQHNFLANCNSIDKLNLAKKNERFLAVLPLHHALALTVTLMLPVLYGHTIIYPASIRGDDLVQAMQEKTPSVFLAVPQIFYLFNTKIQEKLNSSAWFTRTVLGCIIQAAFVLRKISGINISKIIFKKVHEHFGSKMRLFLSGGARLDPKTASQLYKLGFTVLEGYGLTETAPVLTLNPLNKPKFGSVGKPLSDVKIRIENKNTQGAGEVVAQGPNIMQGYYKNKQATDAVLKDNWFYTGDLGYLDKQGYLFLTGRAKEVIVLSSGLNIFPEEIEAIYLEGAPVKEMCVFEAPSRAKLKDATMLWAMVMPDLDYFKNIGEVNLKQVLKGSFDNISRTLPEYKRIRGFTVSIESLPRTLLGKIKRFEVKKLYLEKTTQIKTQKAQVAQLTPEQKQLLNTEQGKTIVDFLNQHTQADAPILPGDLLELDLGLDSLGRIELASGLEKQFKIKINDELIGSVFTVEDLIKGIIMLQSKGTASLAEDESQAIAGKRAWEQRLKALPLQENLNKIDLKPDFWSWFLGTIFIEIVRVILFGMYRLKVSGQENVPRQGPYIIFANHTSYLDGFIIGAALPAHARLSMFFLGFRAYFNVPIIRNLIKIGRIIPLDFATHLLEALRSSYYILDNNKNLCLFPEGSRSLDGKLQPFKKGFGILAKETGAKLIPVCIKGAYEAWPRTSNWPKLHKLQISFAPSIDMEQAQEQGFLLGAKDSYEAITLAGEQAIRDLEKQM